jgi:hypothetical protein
LGEALRQAQQTSKSLEIAFKLPMQMPRPIMPHELSRAASMWRRLRVEIAEFEKTLDPAHEVGVHLVQGDTLTVIHVEDVGYHGPDLVTFEGREPNGNRVRILQHVSQVSMSLKALPKLNDKPIRLGFLAKE